MTLLPHAHNWIERAWSETGSKFAAGDVPVVQFGSYNVDDIGFPFKNQPVQSWRLVSGKLKPDPHAKVTRVPYVAFCLNEAKAQMGVQLGWAPRFGYGYVISFSAEGVVLAEEMRWVS